MTEGIQRRLAAIVAADVAEYSRLVRADEEGTLRTLRAHRRELTDPLIEQFGGRIANTAGDSLLLEFPSAVEAVRCTLAIQAGMAERNSGIDPERQIKFRIGINLGDVVADGDDLLGDGVNVAARIEALAEPGGICIARIVRDSVRDQLEVALEDMGEVEVKNIARPVRVFRVSAAPDVIAAIKPAGIPSPASPAQSRWKWAAAAVVLIAIILAGGGVLWWWQQPDFEPADPKKYAYKLPEKPSIAVLPFDNLTGDKSQDYLGDGLTENIIAVLASSPDLFVISRNSSFTYKGKATKVQQVAEELGVRYVLEGSVQKAGDQFRVTAQLIDALNGKHIWVERYYRQLIKLFAVQDEIAENIFAAMELKLTTGSISAYWREEIGNPELYKMTVQWRVQFRKWSKQGNKEGYATAEKIAKIKPAGQWLAVRLKAWLKWQQVAIGVSDDPKRDTAEAFELALHAQKLKKSPANETLLSLLALRMGRYDEAITHARRALEMEAANPETLLLAGSSLSAAGQPREAIQLIKQGIRLQPTYPAFALMDLQLAYLSLNELDEARKVATGLLASKTQNEIAHVSALRMLTVVSVLEGDIKSGQEYLSQARKKDEGLSVGRLRPMLAHWKDRAFIDRYLNALRKAGLPE